MYVYFIKAGKKGAIKIGKSNHPEKRLSELQTGNPYKLKLVAYIHCETEKDAFDMEKKMHRVFRKRRLNGEWFHSDIDFKKATEITINKKDNRMRSI